MRFLFSIRLFCLAFLLNSCSWNFFVYIRNTSAKTAIIDVFLLDKTQMAILPNKVTVANRVVNFKAGFRKHFDSSQNVEWVDTSHFKFYIAPQKTIDLTDMAGSFRNGYPSGAVRVTVSLNNKTDTLVYGGADTRHHKFVYDHVGVAFHVLHYDIKEKVQ
jgi:hypothetical protein